MLGETFESRATIDFASATPVLLLPELEAVDVLLLLELPHPAATSTRDATAKNAAKRCLGQTLGTITTLLTFPPTSVGSSMQSQPERECDVNISSVDVAR
jgi:hypothetical protein